MSSATGDLFDNHDVISLKVYEIELSDEDAAAEALDVEADAKVGVAKRSVDDVEVGSASSSSRDQDGGGGGFFKYFLVLVVLCLIVGVVIYFYKEDRSKRFY